MELRSLFLPVVLLYYAYSLICKFLYCYLFKASRLYLFIRPHCIHKLHRCSFVLIVLINYITRLMASSMSVCFSEDLLAYSCIQLLFLGRLLQVDLIKLVSNVRPPVRPSVRPQKVAWSVYVSVCWSHSWAQQKQLNCSGCLLEGRLGWPKEPRITWGSRSFQIGRGNFWGLLGPLKSIVSYCCSVCSKRAITASEWLLQPTDFIAAD